MQKGRWLVMDGKRFCVLKDDHFKQQYAELPVIPDIVNEVILEYRGTGCSIADFFHDVMESVTSINPGWAIKNANLLARAWLDGYQVEEDK